MSYHPSHLLPGKTVVGDSRWSCRQDGGTPAPLILGADPTQDFTEPSSVFSGWAPVKTWEESVLETKLGFHSGLVIPCCVTLRKSLNLSEPVYVAIEWSQQTAFAE